MSKALINDFGGYLLNERRTSASTIESYIRDVTGFDAYTCSLGLQLTQADESTIKAYISHLKELGKAASTMSRCVSSLKCFYAYLLSAGLISSDPSVGIEKLKVTQKSPDILSYADIRKILAIPKGGDSKSLRDKAMLETLYATGMRASEIISLDICDVDVIGKSIRCADGNKLRLIPLHPTAIKALESYLQRSRPALVAAGSECPALFVNLNGERLTRQGFWKLMKYYQDKAGLDKNISPKTLRNSFAVNLMENGADVYSVKEMLGHTDIVSTKKYNSLVNKRVRDAYYSSHPRI